MNILAATGIGYRRSSIPDFATGYRSPCGRPFDLLDLPNLAAVLQASI